MLTTNSSFGSASPSTIPENSFSRRSHSTTKPQPKALWACLYTVATLLTIVKHSSSFLAGALLGQGFVYFFDPKGTIFYQGADAKWRESSGSLVAPSVVGSILFLVLALINETTYRKNTLVLFLTCFSQLPGNVTLLTPTLERLQFHFQTKIETATGSKLNACCVKPLEKDQLLFKC